MSSLIYGENTPTTNKFGVGGEGRGRLLYFIEKGTYFITFTPCVFPFFLEAYGTMCDTWLIKFISQHDQLLFFKPNVFTDEHNSQLCGSIQKKILLKALFSLIFTYPLLKMCINFTIRHISFTLVFLFNPHLQTFLSHGIIKMLKDFALCSLHFKFIEETLVLNYCIF